MVALIGIEDGKASAVVGVTEDLAKTHSAVELVKAGVLPSPPQLPQQEVRTTKRGEPRLLTRPTTKRMQLR